MHPRKTTAAKYGWKSWASLCLLIVAQAAFAQKKDSIFINVEVDQIPRSLYARTPSVAVDEDENFTVAWSAESKGLPEIFLRRFDAIGRPLTDIRALSEFVGDTLSIANPQLAAVGNGFTWLVWQQTRARAASEVMGMVLSQDLNVARGPFSIHIDNDPYTNPRVAVDRSGRVCVAWIIDTLPVSVVARLFGREGAPLTGLFTITQDSQIFRIGEPLSLAVSSTGMFAAAWHAYEANTDLIYLRLFSDENQFTSDPIPIAQREVYSPSVAFVSANEVVAQWFTNAAAPVLFAQRFDLNLKPVAQAIEVANARNLQFRPALVAANENGSYDSFWSVRDDKDTTSSNVFTRAFLANDQPLDQPLLLTSTPQSTYPLTELAAAYSRSGNYVLSYTGNDSSSLSRAPRVGAVLRKRALPDLQIFDLQVTPANPTRADSVFVAFKVSNNGFAPAAATSTLLNLTSNVVEEQLVALPLLANGQTQSFRYNLGTLKPHSYTMRVTVDDPQEVPEVDEKNNSAAQLFKVEEAPTLVVDRLALNFTAAFGQPNPTAQIFTLKNSGSGVLRWSLTKDQPWVTVTPDTGAIDSTSRIVNVAVNIVGLLAGTHQANIIVDSNGGRAVVAITLTIAPPLPNLSFTPNALQFAATQGGGNPPNQPFIIRNAGSGMLTWKLTSNQPWLVVGTDSSATTSADTVLVSIELANLVAGTYNGALDLRSNGGNGAINVTLIVSPQPPLLDISPRALNFVATEGTANPPLQPITIRNIGGGTLQWSVIEQSTWLFFTPRSGSTTTETDTVRVGASITRLGVGTHTDVFQVNAVPGGTLEVRVTFVVNPRPRLPDLVVLAQERSLNDCFAANYDFKTEFLVQNLGEAPAAASVAHLLIENQIRQRVNVPALDVGASFRVLFNLEPLAAGFNRIACEIGANFSESANSNNLAQFTEWAPRRGDANLDSLINLQDLFRLVDLVLNRNNDANDARACWAANVSTDLALDIADVVQFLDVLLNGGSAGAFPQAGELDLVLLQTEAQRTRLSWNAATPLRAWQASWRLPAGARDIPLRSFQREGYEIDWKISQQQLKLLVWRASGAATQRGQAHAFELPIALAAATLEHVIGANDAGEMMRLAAKSVVEELPATFSLSPAYPNPWRKAAQQKILWRYELPEAANARLLIYNLLGQEVQRVQLGNISAGRGEISWDGRDHAGREAAPGIYFIEFIAGKIKQRQRLVVF